jgi:hypothetical protein
MFVAVTRTSEQRALHTKSQSGSMQNKGQNKKFFDACAENTYRSIRGSIERELEKQHLFPLETVTVLPLLVRARARLSDSNPQGSYEGEVDLACAGS